MLGQKNWANKFWGILGILVQTFGTHFGTLSPLSMFFIIQPIFLQKLDLYIHIPNIYLGLGLELDFVRVSVVRGCKLVNAFKLCCNNLPSHLNDHQSSKKFDYTSSYLLEGGNLGIQGLGTTFFGKS